MTQKNVVFSAEKLDSDASDIAYFLGMLPPPGRAGMISIRDHQAETLYQPSWKKSFFMLLFDIKASYVSRFRMITPEAIDPETGLITPIVVIRNLVKRDKKRDEHVTFASLIEKHREYNRRWHKKTRSTQTAQSTEQAGSSRQTHLTDHDNLSENHETTVETLMYVIDKLTRKNPATRKKVADLLTSKGIVHALEMPPTTATSDH